jgi:hypothetical protein
MYDQLKDFDILTPKVIETIKRGALAIRGGKIVQVQSSGMEPDSPWIFQAGEDQRHCRKWNQVYFLLYGIISRHCFNCYKVVVRPKTLKELMKVREIQKKLGISGKCGVERRPTSMSKGLYAGFWYCPLGGGLEGARELHKKVELEVKREIGFQTPVILKRACTEMEDAIGPSDGWCFPEVQHRVEDYLDSIYEVEQMITEQPEFLKVHILKEWIEHAWENRDETVREFLSDPKVSFGLVGTVTYQEGSGTAKEQPPRVCEGSGETRRPEIQGLSDYL